MKRWRRCLPRSAGIYAGREAASTHPPHMTSVVEKKESTLQICDADTDVIFDTERQALTRKQ